MLFSLSTIPEKENILVNGVIILGKDSDSFSTQFSENVFGFPGNIFQN